MTDVLAELAAAFAAADPIPAAVRLAAERALPAGRLASGAHALPELRGMRGTGQVIDFGALLVEAGRAGRTVWLSGLATGPVAGLRVRWPAGGRAVAVDEFGGFRVTGLPAGPLCLAVRRPGEPLAVTPWFVA